MQKILNQLRSERRRALNGKTFFKGSAELEYIKGIDFCINLIKNAQVKPKKITVPFTWSDVEEMHSAENGEVFDWTFGGVNIIITKKD